MTRDPFAPRVEDEGDMIYVHLPWLLCGSVVPEDGARAVTDIWIEDERGERLWALDWLAKSIAARHVAALRETTKPNVWYQAQLVAMAAKARSAS